VYTVVGTVDPQSKRATFQFHLNPLVSWIWIGVLILIGGATLSLWPELSFKEIGAWGYVRAGAGVATSIMLAVWLTASPTSAYAASERPRPTVSTAPPERELPLGAFGALGAGLVLGTGLSMAGRRRTR
jgi:cytochrome c-type biogenesis protein CcmF